MNTTYENNLAHCRQSASSKLELVGRQVLAAAAFEGTGRTGLAHELLTMALRELNAVIDMCTMVRHTCKTADVYEEFDQLQRRSRDLRSFVTADWQRLAAELN